MVHWLVSWARGNPKRALTAAAVVVGGMATATGVVPLRAVADTLAALAPILGG